MKCISIAVIFGLSFSAYAANINLEEAKYLADQYQLLAQKYQRIANGYQKLATPIQNTIIAIKKTENTNTTPQILSQITPLIIPQHNQWKGTNASIGGTLDTGNSAGTNFDSVIFLVYQPMPDDDYGWKFSLNSNYQYIGTEEKGATTNKLTLVQLSQYMFDHINGVFANLAYINDKNDTFTYQYNESIGYTRMLYHQNDMSIVLQLGPGFLQTQETGTNEFKNVPSWLTIATYTWNLTPDTAFVQTFQNTAASTNTNTTLTSSLTTTLYKNLAIQTSFEWQYDSKVASDKKSVNTLTKLSLVYNF
jgi:putative salt-induced outer membrane protein